MIRVSKDKYYWDIARAVSERGTCLSAHFGVVIVKNDSIVSTGYVGAPRGVKSCLERGECLRRKNNIPSGERYELCASVHAEQNAIIHAGREKSMGAIMYLYGALGALREDGKLLNAYPCFICKKMIINAGIEKLISNDSDGELRTFNIADWVKEWQERSLFEDTEKYKA